MMSESKASTVAKEIAGKLVADWRSYTSSPDRLVFLITHALTTFSQQQVREAIKSQFCEKHQQVAEGFLSIEPTWKPSCPICANKETVREVEARVWEEAWEVIAESMRKSPADLQAFISTLEACFTRRRSRAQEGKAENET